MRSRGLLAGMAAVAVLAAGCGDGSDDATEEVSTVTIDLLGETEAAGSARIALAFDGEQPGFGEGLHTTLGLEGVIDFEAREHDLAGEIEMRSLLPEGSVDEPAPPSRGALAMRRVDGTSYDRWTTDDAPDAPWTRALDEAEVDPSDAPTETTVVEGADEEIEVEGEEGSVTIDGDEVVVEDVPDDDADDEDRSALDALFSLDGDLDPTAVLDQVQDMATTFTEVGREDVRGTPTTHHRAEIDPDDMPSLAVADVEPVVDVWVDDDGRLRRLELGPARLELWDFGVEVEVEEPSPVADPDGPDSDVGPFASPVESGEWALQASGDAAGRRVGGVGCAARGPGRDPDLSDAGGRPCGGRRPARGDHRHGRRGPARTTTVPWPPAATGRRCSRCPRPGPPCRSSSPTTGRHPVPCPSSPSWSTIGGVTGRSRSSATVHPTSS